nr:metallopeptidase TldD-related protein [Kofleriaceae bacterium]
MKGLAIVAVLAALPATAAPATSSPAFDDDPAVRAMHDELARAMSQLALPRAPKPYYLAYTLWDVASTRVDASFGATVSASTVPLRQIAIDLRVGDYAFDNSNTATGRRLEASLPLDDDYDVMRRELWLATDGAYKSSIESFDRKQAVARAETKDADDVGSFSTEPAARTVDATAVRPDLAAAAADQATLEALAQKLSAVFRGNHDAFTAEVSISASRGRDLFVSSEGAAGAQGIAVVRVRIDATSQASDGMPLHAGTSIWAPTVAQLPPDAELVAAAERVSRELSDLRKAPVVDDYAGPILVRGVAADQILRGLLVEELGGTPPPKSDRPGSRNSDGALVSKLTKRILPLGVSIVDDPAPRKVGAAAVLPSARFDDEGVAPQKVSIVENGTLKRFLMSRTPRKGFEHSNGHGYSAGGAPVRAHAGNLYVSSTRAVGDAELKRRAIAAANDEGNPYLLVIDRFAERGSEPEVLEKLYVDGHEELVRGGAIGSAITLRSLRDILAVGATPTLLEYDDSGVTGTASIAAPALLFRDGDIKKPTGGQRPPPIASRPDLPAN